MSQTRQQIIDEVAPAIARNERQRMATLIEASAEMLVDFTGGSTLAALELVAFLLRLDHSDEQ